MKQYRKRLTVNVCQQIVKLPLKDLTIIGALRKWPFYWQTSAGVKAKLVKNTDVQYDRYFNTVWKWAKITVQKLGFNVMLIQVFKDLFDPVYFSTILLLRAINQTKCLGLICACTYNL